MDGDEDGTNNEHTGAPAAPPPAEAPNVAARRNMPGKQQSVFEQAFVDRIRWSDRLMICLTAAIAISGIASALIFWKQLAAMRGQLTEMTATPESADSSMAAQLKILRDQVKFLGDQTTAIQETTRISNESLLSQRRAWLWPMDFNIESSFEDGSRPNLRVPVLNTGREPAEFVVSNFRADYGEVTNGAKAEDWLQFPVWSKHADELQWQSMCKGLQPHPGNTLVYPSQTPSIFLTVDESLVDLREIRSRAKLLLVLGCIAYETAGKIHHSSFCVYLQPINGRSISEWVFASCPAGNHGD